MADFETRGAGPLRIVKLPVAIEEKNAMDLKVLLTEMVNGGAQKIMCDLSRNHFIADGGIQALVSVHKLLQKIHGELSFLHAAPAVRARFEREGVAYLFKFYDLEESLNILALNTLVKYFDQYENLESVQTRRSPEGTRVEILLEFDGGRTMREVQRLIDAVKTELLEQHPQVQVLVVASATREEPLAPSMVTSGPRVPG